MPSGNKESREGFGISTAIQSAELAAVAVAASAKAEIEAGYIMALKRPRLESESRIRIVNVCKNLIFAKKAKYSKPVGGKDPVVGPSIRMAEEVLRHWGNVLVQQSAIYDDNRKRIVKIVVKDLESNLSFSTEVTIEKKVERKKAKGREVIGERLNSYGEKVSIVVATEDEMLVKEAALCSKAIRNNGLRLIPEHIIEEALETVDETIRRGVTDNLEEEAFSILKAFSTIGVTSQNLEKKLGHPLEQCQPSEIVELRSIYNTIKDGQAKWGDFLEDAPKNDPKPAKGSMDGFGAGDPSTHKGVAEPVGKAEESKIRKLSAAQKRKLEYEIKAAGLSRDAIKSHFDVGSLDDLPSSKMQDALKYIGGLSERESGSDDE